MTDTEIIVALILIAVGFYNAGSLSRRKHEQAAWERGLAKGREIERQYSSDVDSQRGEAQEHFT